MNGHMSSFERMLAGRDLSWQQMIRGIGDALVLRGSGIVPTEEEPLASQYSFDLAGALASPEFEEAKQRLKELSPGGERLDSMRQRDELIGAARFHGITNPELMDPQELEDLVAWRRELIRQQDGGETSVSKYLYDVVSTALPLLGEGIVGAGLNAIENAGRLVPFLKDPIERSTFMRQSDQWLAMVREGFSADIPTERGREIATRTTGALGMLIPAVYTWHVAGLARFLPGASLIGKAITPAGRAALRGAASNIPLQDPTAPLTQQAVNYGLGAAFGLGDLAGTVGRTITGVGIGYMAGAVAAPDDPMVQLLSAATGGTIFLAGGAALSRIQREFPSRIDVEFAGVRPPRGPIVDGVYTIEGQDALPPGSGGALPPGGGGELPSGRFPALPPGQPETIAPVGVESPPPVAGRYAESNELGISAFQRYMASLGEDDIDAFIAGFNTPMPGNETVLTPYIQRPSPRPISLEEGPGEAAQIVKQETIMESPALAEISNQTAMDDADVAKALVASYPGQVGLIQNVRDAAQTMRKILMEQMPTGVGPQDFRVVTRPATSLSSQFDPSTMQQTDILVSSGRPITNQTVQDYEAFGMFSGQRARVVGGQDVVIEQIGPETSVVKPLYGGPSTTVSTAALLPQKSSFVVDDVPGLYEDFAQFARQRLEGQSLASGIEPIGLYSNEGATQVPLLLEEYVGSMTVDPKGYYGASLRNLLEQQHIAVLRNLSEPVEQVMLRGLQADLENLASFMRTGSGRVGTAVDPSVVKKMGATMYSGNLGPVIVKEALQNSFDATRHLGRDGQITVEIDSGIHKFKISDNGTGMSPEVSANEFMDVSKSFKPEGSSGAFGFAKVALMLYADHFEMNTVWKGDDGFHRTTIEGSGEDWLSGNLLYNTERVGPQQTGTDLEIDVNKDVQPQWSYALPFINNYQKFSHGPRLKYILDGHEQMPIDMRTYRTVKEPVTYDLAQTIDVPGAKIEVRSSPRTSKSYSEIHVLNRGLYQFSDTVIVRDGELPEDIVFDVQTDPSIEATDVHYPFTSSREKLRGATAVALDNLKENLRFVAGQQKARELNEALTKPAEISGTPFGVYRTNKSISEGLMNTLASRSYAASLSTVMSDTLDRLARSIMPFEARVLGVHGAEGSLLGYKFGGFGINQGWVGVNISQEIIAGMMGTGSTADLHNVILTNPWAMVQEADLVSFGNPESTYRMLGAMTYQTLLHELSHQLARGHNETFAGVVTRSGEAMTFDIETSAMLVSRLSEVWRENYAAVRKDLPTVQQEWQGANLFGGISDHLAADDPSFIFGWDGSLGQPGLGGPLAAGGSPTGPEQGPTGPGALRAGTTDFLTNSRDNLGAAFRGTDEPSIRDLAETRGFIYNKPERSLTDAISGQVIPFDSEDSLRGFLRAVQRETIDDSPLGSIPLEVADTPVGWSQTSGPIPGEWKTPEWWSASLDEAMADAFARFGEEGILPPAPGEPALLNRPTVQGIPVPPRQPPPPGDGGLPPEAALPDDVNAPYLKGLRKIDGFWSRLGTPTRNMTFRIDSLLKPFGFPAITPLVQRMQDARLRMVSAAYPWENEAMRALKGVRHKLMRDGSFVEILLAPPEFHADLAARKGFTPQEQEALSDIGLLLSRFNVLEVRSLFPDLPANYVQIMERFEEALPGDPVSRPREAVWGPKLEDVADSFVEKDITAFLGRYFRSFYKVKFVNQPYRDIKDLTQKRGYGASTLERTTREGSLPGAANEWLDKWADDTMWGLDPADDLLFKGVHSSLNSLLGLFNQHVSAKEIQSMFNWHFSTGYLAILGDVDSFIRDLPQGLVGATHIGLDKAGPVLSRLIKDEEYRTHAMDIGYASGWLTPGHGVTVDPDVFGGMTFREVMPTRELSITQKESVASVFDAAYDRVLSPLGLEQGIAQSKLNALRAYGWQSDWMRVWNAMSGYETAWEALRRYGDALQKGASPESLEAKLLKESRVERFQGPIQDLFLEYVRRGDFESAARSFGRNMADKQTRHGISEAPAFWRGLGPYTGRLGMRFANYNTQMLSEMSQIFADQRIPLRAKASYLGQVGAMQTVAGIATAATGWNWMRVGVVGSAFTLTGASLFSVVNSYQRLNAWLSAHDPSGPALDPTQTALLATAGRRYGMTYFTVNPTRALWNPLAGPMRSVVGGAEQLYTWGPEAALRFELTGQSGDPSLARRQTGIQPYGNPEDQPYYNPEPRGSF